MELTKKILEDRLNNLVAQREQLLRQVNACEGGIIVVQGLLNDLDCKEPKKNEGDGSKKARPSGGKK